MLLLCAEKEKNKKMKKDKLEVRESTERDMEKKESKRRKNNPQMEVDWIWDWGLISSSPSYDICSTSYSNHPSRPSSFLPSFNILIQANALLPFGNFYVKIPEVQSEAFL